MDFKISIVLSCNGLTLIECLCHLLVYFSQALFDSIHIIDVLTCGLGTFCFPVDLRRFSLDVDGCDGGRASSSSEVSSGPGWKEITQCLIIIHNLNGRLTDSVLSILPDCNRTLNTLINCRKALFCFHVDGCDLR